MTPSIKYYIQDIELSGTSSYNFANADSTKINEQSLQLIYPQIFKCDSLFMRRHSYVDDVFDFIQDLNSDLIPYSVIFSD